MNKKIKIWSVDLLVLGIVLLTAKFFLINSEAACLDTNGYWDEEFNRCVCFEYNSRGLCQNSTSK